MFVRNSGGKIVEIKSNHFLNDKEFYLHLWKIIFNIDLSLQETSFNERLVEYIRGDSLFV